MRPSLGELARFFCLLGATGFGGPIALVGYMEHEFAVRRQWASRQEVRDGIAFAQLAPGPLAAQLAMYLGWLSGGARGATVAGFAFIAPSFLMVVGLALLYQRTGGMPWLQGAFYGVGAAVIAVIAKNAFTLARTALQRDRLRWALFGLSAVVTVWKEAEIAWLFVLSGLVIVAARWTPDTGNRGAALIAWARMPREPLANWIPVIDGTTPIALSGTLFLFFASAGLFVFGSGLAIVPFLHRGVVLEMHWLTERQFLDAVAVALITPGPVVIVVAFIGFLVAGLPGALAAAAGVFAPVYVITLLAAPHFNRFKENVRVRAFVDGVTAAAIGAIGGAAIVLGRRSVVDIPTAVIASGTLLLLLRTSRPPDALIVLAAGAAGIVLKAFPIG